MESYEAYFSGLTFRVRPHQQIKAVQSKLKIQKFRGVLQHDQAAEEYSTGQQCPDNGRLPGQKMALDRVRLGQRWRIVAHDLMSIGHKPNNDKQGSQNKRLLTRPPGVNGVIDQISN